MRTIEIVQSLVGCSYLIFSLSLASVFESNLHVIGHNLKTIHFIGDLHGDVQCARYWIQSTGVVKLNESPWKWTGGADTAIVFMGDYVDKGPTSRQVGTITFFKGGCFNGEIII